MIDLFDLYADPDHGIIKARTSMLSFFNRNAYRLAKALSSEFLYKLQQRKRSSVELVGSKKDVTMSEADVKSINMIKVYDTNAKAPAHRNKAIVNSTAANTVNGSTKKEHKSKLQQVSDHPNKPRTIDIKTHDVVNMNQRFIHNTGIAELYQEILPKNKGWLMRKSNRHDNKWSTVFFEVKDNKLISTKPTTLKVTFSLI